MSQDLQERWVKIARRYGCSKATARASFNEVASRYKQSHRHYHDLSHLDHVFAHFNEVRYYLHHQDSVALALFLHDVIYDPQSQTNEEDSAVYADALLRKFPDIPPYIIQNVKRMILATKTHQFDDQDQDTAYMLDMDLSILGSDRKTYDTYCDNIRKEYAHIKDDAAFLTARRDKMLIPYSERQIYKTTYFQTRFQAKARNNMHREIRSINMRLNKF